MMEQSTKESLNQNATKPIKVLIADDDPPTRLLLKAGIIRWGYSVVEAGDGEAAWEIVKNSDPPDMVILDWLMPKLDGVALCQRIQDQLDIKPYIILLTQMSGSQNIIKGLEAGADEYLSKPFNMAELRSRLSVGAKLITNKNQLQEYVSKVNELIDHVTNISTQISTSLQEASQDLNKKNNLDKISVLNLELLGSLQTLKDFNLFVSNNIKSPLK